ncbi:MAG: SO2930 family diheme c-type cytochrome [Pseudomonadota bacterium]
MLRILFALNAAVLLAACGSETSTVSNARPVFHEEGYPERLSDWNVVRSEGGALRLAAGTTPYDLATPLFTDYALKLRTVSLPEGAKADYRDDDVFAFPVGTIITKTFYFGQNADGAVTDSGAPAFSDGALPMEGVRLMETRVLAHRADGWVAIPYVWNEAQTEAMLKRTGAIATLTLARAGTTPVEFPYVVPNQNQCAGCHAPNNTTRAISPIGPKARHLNTASVYHDGANQIAYWRDAGLLAISEAEFAAAPQNAVWTDETASVDARARAYLDSNCSHCHNSVGPADTSGLDLTPTAAGPSLGYCKAAIAAGDGAGGRPYDIVPGHPDDSILLFRMETTDPAAMMPELGRALAHDEGVALIREWIAGLDSDGCA